METDVLIVGGGLAGLTLARQLRMELPDCKITIIERRKHPAPEAAFKVGESSVEIGAHYFGVRLGLTEHLEQQQLPKLGLRFFFPSGNNSDITKRLEIGSSTFPKVPSFQLDRGRLENYLREINVASGITFIDECRGQDFTLADEGTNDLHEIKAIHKGELITIKTKWFVDASSRFSLIKKKLGLKKESPHKNNAVWFRISTEINIDDWSENLQWRDRIPKYSRRLSTNHLMGPGYWVWLIPLASGSTSVGIVVDSKLHPLSEMEDFESSLRWLYKYEPQCAKVVDSLRDKLQDFHILKNYAHHCTQVYSKNRWCLTGEAGTFSDPFYSPGSDYIALSNDFVTDLIKRDMKGENIDELAVSYNRLYLQFYEVVMLIYEGQYPHFGNDFIMMQKLLWDSAIYLSVTCLLYFNRKICDLNFMNRLTQEMSRYTRMNFRVQQHFKNMNSEHVTKLENCFLDFAQTGFFGSDLNRQLLNTFENDDALIEKIKSNINHLEELSNNILSNRNIAEDLVISKLNSQVTSKESELSTS